MPNLPGGGELLILVVVLLVLFGAKRLPELARSLGKAKSEFRKGATEAAAEEGNGQNGSDKSS